MTETDRMVALMRRLKIEMNGAVTDAMREYGGGQRGYGLNYGVSLPTIREIAQTYAPDHALALLLWRQDVRELKLAALFVDDPAAVTARQMEDWASTWRAAELAEQCAMQLFWRSPEAWATATQWARSKGNDERKFKRSAAFYMLGRLAADRDTVNDAAWATLLDAPQVFDTETTERSAVYALREIYRHRPQLRESISACLGRVPREVADEVRWQIEYLP